MDDERYTPGMPVLQRQPVREPGKPRPAPNLPPSLQGLPPRSVPETRPTPLQPHYINLSVIVLICGAIAITALELGAGFGNPLVKLCVFIGGADPHRHDGRCRAADLARQPGHGCRSTAGAACSGWHGSSTRRC